MRRIPNLIRSFAPVERHLLWTPLDEDTCWQRLRDSRVNVRSTRDGFALYRAGRAPTPLRWELGEVVGRFAPQPGRTRINVRIGFAWHMLLVYLGVAVSLLAHLGRRVVQLIRGLVTGEFDAVFIVLSFASVVVGALFLVLQQRIIRSETAWLLDFLKEVLEAEEVSSDQASEQQSREGGS